MKHEITTMNTKKTLAASLKLFLMKKRLNKITVSEIAANCGVNRKTFYYHFEDVYALLKWMLEQEAIEVVKNFDLMAEYEEAILFVMDYVESNDAVLNNICNSLGREELKRFFYTDFIGITRSFVSGIERREKIRVSADYKEFLCQFYTEALSAMLLEWIHDHTDRNREKTVLYITTVLSAAIPSSLHAWAEL